MLYERIWPLSEFLKYGNKYQHRIIHSSTRKVALNLLASLTKSKKPRFVSVAFNALGIAGFKIYRLTITARHSLSLLCTAFGIASLNATEIDISQNIYSTEEFS